MNIKHSALLFMLGFAILSSTALAGPRGSSNLAREYAIGSSENAPWSCGIFYMGREKEVVIENFTTTLDDKKYAAYVGHTVAPWATIYGIAGVSESSVESFSSADSDQTFVYGAAANFDLFTHEIQDPYIMENQIRVNADIAYYLSQVEAFGEDQDIGQFDASLTVSLVNDLDGVALYMPESIALFGGPMFSQLTGDVDDEPDDAVGLTAGLEVYQTKRVAYYFRVDNFANVGYAAGLNVRF